MESQDSLLTSLLFGRHSSDSSPDPVNPYLSSIVGNSNPGQLSQIGLAQNQLNSNPGNQFPNPFKFPEISLRESSQQPVEAKSNVVESKELQDFSTDWNNSRGSRGSRGSFQNRSLRKNVSVSRKASIFESLPIGKSEAELREAIHEAERNQRLEEEEEENLLNHQEQQFEVQEAGEGAEEKRGESLHRSIEKSPEGVEEVVLVDDAISSVEPHNNLQNIRSIFSGKLTPELEYQDPVTSVSPVAPIEIIREDNSSSYPFPVQRTDNVQSSSSSATPLAHENTDVTHETAPAYSLPSPPTAPPAPIPPPPTLPIPPPPQKIASPDLGVGASPRQHDAGQMSAVKSFPSSRGSVTYLENSKVSLVELSQSDIMLRMPFQVRQHDVMDETNVDDYEQDPRDICITIQGPRQANNNSGRVNSVKETHESHHHHHPSQMQHHTYNSHNKRNNNVMYSPQGGPTHNDEYHHHAREQYTVAEQYSPRGGAIKHSSGTVPQRMTSATHHPHHPHNNSSSGKGNSYHHQKKQPLAQPMWRSESPGSSFSSSSSSGSVRGGKISSTRKYGESVSPSVSAGRESEAEEENAAEGSSSTLGSLSDQVIMHWMPLKTSLKSKVAGKRKKHKKEGRSKERSETTAYQSPHRTEISRHVETDGMHTARPGDQFHGGSHAVGGGLPPLQNAGASAAPRLVVGPSTYMKPIIWSFGDSPTPNSESRSPLLPPPPLPPAPIIQAPGMDPELLRQLDQMKDMFRRLQMEMQAMRQRMEHTMEAYHKHLAALIAAMQSPEETPVATPSLSLASQSALGVMLPPPPKIDIQPLLGRIDELQKKAEQLEWAAAMIPPQQKAEKGAEPAPAPIPFDLSALSQTTKEMNAELAEWLQKSIAELRTDLLDMVEVKLNDGTAKLEELASGTRSGGAAGGPRMSWMGTTVSSAGDLSMVSLPPHASNAAAVLSDCQDEIRKMVEMATKQLQDALQQAQQVKAEREAASNAALNEERARLLEMHQNQRERERERREREKKWLEERERSQRDMEEQQHVAHSAMSGECAELASKVEMMLQHVREEVLLALSTLPNFGGLTLDQWEGEVEKIMSTMVEESKGTSNFLYERFSQFMSYLQAQRKERCTRAQASVLESTEAMEQRRHEHHLQLQHLNHLLNRHAEAANEIVLTFSKAETTGGDNSSLGIQKLKDEAAANNTRLRALREHLNRLLEASKQRQRHHKDRLEIPMKNVEREHGNDQHTLDRILSTIERITAATKQRSQRPPPPIPPVPTFTPVRPAAGGSTSLRPSSVKRRGRKVIRVTAPAPAPSAPTPAYIGPTALEIAEMRRQEEREKAAMEAEIGNLKDRIRQVRLRKKQERKAEQERKRQEMAKTEVKIQNLQRMLHEEEEEIHNIEKAQNQLKRQLDMKSRDTQRRWHQEEEALRRKVEQFNRDLEQEDHCKRKEYKAAVAQVEEEIELQNVDVARAEEEIVALETAIAAKREQAEADERASGAQLAALQQQKANLLDRIRAEVVELQQLLEKTQESKRAASAATLSTKAQVQQEQQQMQQVLLTVRDRLHDFDRQNKRSASKEKQALQSARRSLSVVSAEKKAYLQQEIQKEKRLQREILNSARSLRSASTRHACPTAPPPAAAEASPTNQEQELLLLSMERLKDRQNLVERHLDEQYEQLERHRDALNSARSAVAVAAASSSVPLYSTSSANGSPPRSPRADMASSLVHVLANQSLLSSLSPLPVHRPPPPIVVSYTNPTGVATPASSSAAASPLVSIPAPPTSASRSNSVVELLGDGQRRDRSNTNPPPTAREIPQVARAKDVVGASLPASSIPEQRSTSAMQSSQSVVEEQPMETVLATPPPVLASRSSSAVQLNAGEAAGVVEDSVPVPAQEPLPPEPSSVSEVLVPPTPVVMGSSPMLAEGEDLPSARAASSSSQLGLIRRKSSTNVAPSDSIVRQRSGRNSRTGQSISILQTSSGASPRVDSAHKKRRSQDRSVEGSRVGSAPVRRPGSVNSETGSVKPSSRSSSRLSKR